MLSATFSVLGIHILCSKFTKNKTIVRRKFNPSSFVIFTDFSFINFLKMKRITRKKLNPALKVSSYINYFKDLVSNFIKNDS